MHGHLRTAGLAAGFGATLALGVLIGQAGAGQPHMQNALGLIASARAELQTASGDKGGHRTNAIRYLNAAAYEVKAGIAFDQRR